MYPVTPTIVLELAAQTNGTAGRPGKPTNGIHVT